MNKNLRGLITSVIAIFLAVNLSPVILESCSSVTTAEASVAHAAVAKPVITVKRAATGKVTIKNKTTYLLGTVTSKGKLTYKSSNKKVLTVSTAGKLTAKNPGTATVTITAKSGTVKSTKTVKVTVVKVANYKPVKTVKATVGRKTLTVGQTTKMTPKLTPTNASNKNVTYKTSNAKVATVDAYGKITAKKAGTAKITVSSVHNPAKKYTITITVKPKQTTSGSATAPTTKPTTKPTPSPDPAPNPGSGSSSSTPSKPAQPSSPSTGGSSSGGSNGGSSNGSGGNTGDLDISLDFQEGVENW